MVNFKDLSDAIGVSMFDVVKEYNILNFVYNSCKQCICDLQENIEYLDFVNDAFIEQDENERDYLDIVTDCIRVNMFYDNGIDTNFIIYYATPNGEILTSEITTDKIYNALNKINVIFDY